MQMDKTDSSSSTTSLVGDDTQSSSFQLPFKPYAPQRELMDAIRQALEIGHRRCSRAGLDTHSEVLPQVSKVREDALASSRIVAAELPTGCGKTAALLSAVLSFQSKLARVSPMEALDFFLERCSCSTCEMERKRRKQESSRQRKSTAGNKKRNQEKKDEELGQRREEQFDPLEAEWWPSDDFFTHFRSPPPSSAATTSVHLAALKRTSTLRAGGNHTPPRCTIFYATRTHAQLAQCVRELRRFPEAATSALKHNVMASRLHYCISRKVRTLVSNGMVAVERNNLGELCDKLVAVHQCEPVEAFSQLASRVLLTPIHRNGGGGDGCNNNHRSHKSSSSHTRTPTTASFAWDIEDLVAEGIANNACPYYASRELVNFANINFVTYSYLLDPLIRKECKFEGAVRNHSIIVIDEAHNVGDVCQDVLSIAISVGTVRKLLAEVEPLTAPSVVESNNNNNTAADYQFLPTYNREFRMTKWTLRELFTFLSQQVLVPVVDWTLAHNIAPPPLPPAETTTTRNRNNQRSPPSWYLNPFGETTSSAGGGSGSSPLLPIPPPPPAGRGEDDDARSLWLMQFKQIYGIISSLGVTFNPFNLSVWALGVLKRLLLVIRFGLTSDKPAGSSRSSCAFAAWVTSAESSHHAADAEARKKSSSADDNLYPYDGAGGGGAVLEIRCLDGSLAFHHLAKSAYCVVLASGTLGPMAQLREDLDLSLERTTFVETMHVVDTKTNFQIGVLQTVVPQPGGSSSSSSSSLSPTPLLCNFSSLANDSFLRSLAASMLFAVDAAVPSGCGVLCFSPNYRVAQRLFALAVELIQQQARLPSSASSSSLEAATASGRALRRIVCSLEPRATEAMPAFLDAHRSCLTTPTGGGSSPPKRSILFGVYRGKLSEGLDFSDKMARLVFCVGIPLQPVLSPSVAAQRHRSGDHWYTSDAVRAVNQALGRCLRHVHDYGAVVLMDGRYGSDASVSSRLPKWCRGQITRWPAVGDMTSDLETFFFTHTELKKASSAAAVPPLTTERRDVEQQEEEEQEGSRSDSMMEQFFGVLSGPNPITTPSVVAARNKRPRDTCETFQAEMSRTQLPPLDETSYINTQQQVSCDAEQAKNRRRYWRSTALKLLYESVDRVEDISFSDVQRKIDDLISD